MQSIDIDPVDPNLPDPWRAGQTVGRYTLLAKIAIGGMAEIWLAKQEGPRGFEKVVVVKKIVDALSRDPEFVEMFLDEARIAAQLNHPNVVQIFDLGEAAGSYYIAMEYLAGENLASIVRAGIKAGHPLPIPYAVRIVASAAEGLAHAHAKTTPDGKPLNIVHRDVSPQNIIVTYDGQVKVVDFGIARAANRSSRTLGNQLKGKASYMSPEQARGQNVDGRSDQFALAIVLFELVTRSRLFQFDEPLMALQAVASPERLPSATSRNPEVPEALSNILARALERNPADRYPTCRNFQSALEDWLRRQDDAPGSAEVAAYMAALFRDRIRERHRLVESARAGELTPSVAHKGLKNDTEQSMPGRSTQMRELEAQKPRRKVGHLAAVAASGALLAVIGATLLVSKLTSDAEPDESAAGAPAAEPASADLGKSPPVASAARAQAASSAGVLAIETDPPGASVAVDGIARGPSPVVLSELRPGDYAISASAKGRQPASKTVSVRAGERTQVVLVLPAETSRPAPSPSESVRPKAAPKAARGLLSLNTVPWTEVYLGSRKLGDTPLIDVPLPAGTHVLRLVNAEKGVSSSIEVEIRPGQTTVKKLSL